MSDEWRVTSLPTQNALVTRHSKLATQMSDNNPNNWPLWEIFIQSKRGLEHKHVGSLHAADAQMAIENARDVYTRRQEGNSIWVVLAEHVHASRPEDAESFYDPADDKVYRHPTFYTMPEGAKYI